MTTTQTAPVEELGKQVLAALEPIGLDAQTRAALAADLDGSRVKKKPGSGHDYLAVHDCIRTANRIFGYGRWGHEVVGLELVGSAPMKNSRNEDGWYTGYRCTVRLTVAGCVPVDGVGYGDAFEKQWSAQITTHELAAKEAESDALKRALMKFGDQFGLILYAKDDEKRRIAAAKEAEAYNQPASEEAIAATSELAARLGKTDVLNGMLAAERRTHEGNIRSGRLAAIHARLLEIAANGEPPPAAPSRGDDTNPSPDDGKTGGDGQRDQTARHALAEGDRAATRDEVAQLLKIAREKGTAAFVQAEAAIARHRAKMQGDVVSATWLAKLTKAILDRPTAPADEPSPGDVEKAFQEAA